MAPRHDQASELRLSHRLTTSVVGEFPWLGLGVEEVRSERLPHRVSYKGRQYKTETQPETIPVRAHPPAPGVYHSAKPSPSRNTPQHGLDPPRLRRFRY